MHKNVIRILPLVALLFLGFDCGLDRGALTQVDPPSLQLPQEGDPADYEGNTIMDQTEGVIIWGGPDESSSRAGEARASLEPIHERLLQYQPQITDFTPPSKLWFMGGNMTADDVLDEYVDSFNPDQLAGEPYEDLEITDLDLEYVGHFGSFRVHEYWYDRQPADDQCPGAHYDLTYGFGITQKKQLIIMEGLPECGLGLVSDVESWSNFDTNLYLNYLVERDPAPEGFEYVDAPELHIDPIISF